MIFLYGREQVLIQRLLIGFKAILECTVFFINLFGRNGESNRVAALLKIKYTLDFNNGYRIYVDILTGEKL